ncbi:MAG: MopE-related protein [Deltaproteobacteria bacterium]
MVTGPSVTLTSPGVGVCRWGTTTCTGTGEFGTWSPCTGAVHPQPVVCGGGLDYRCDGMIDEGCACPPGATRVCYSGTAGTSGVGLCHGGVQTCVAVGSGADWGACAGEVTPTPELCDGMDHDCDGVANSGCGCTLGTSRACYSGPGGTSGVGLCHDGTQRCESVAGGASWGTCTGEVTPTPDTCDGLDHLCTGMAGSGCACIVGATQPCYTGPAASRGVGRCHNGVQTCVVMGASAGWGAACAGEVGPAAAEVCGNGIDDNCNGAIDEGCGGMIACPADQFVDAGGPITLSVTGTGFVSYTWTIVTGPTGGAATAVWAPAPPTAATEVFTPFIVGVYNIRVTGTPSSGPAVSCTFNVTARPHGLRVQLAWDGSGDVDLHLLQGTSTGWVAPNDCYYGNRTTTWGATLDFDNTSASGPENIAMNTPVIGTPYAIGVHNYSGAAGRIATIQVFCGSTVTTVPTQTFTSRALTGAAGGCSANDFWKVATVTFTSATACTITPINTYTASSARCGAGGTY